MRTSSDHLPAKSFSVKFEATGFPPDKAPWAVTSPSASNMSRRNPEIVPFATDLNPFMLELDRPRNLADRQA
jgi:hypothetical protein